MFNHDDSVNDRRPGTKLAASDTETRELWKTTFKEEFAIAGAMFRGEPIEGKLDRIPPKDMLDLAVRCCKVNVNNLVFHSADRLGKLKLHIYLNSGENEPGGKHILKLKSPPGWTSGQQVQLYIKITSIHSFSEFSLQDLFCL